MDVSPKPFIFMKRLFLPILVLLVFSAAGLAQDPTPTPPPQREKAEAVIAKAVQILGGDRLSQRTVADRQRHV